MMIYDRSTVEYLPVFMRKYEEIKAVCGAYDRELAKLYEYAGNVLDSRYVYECSAGTLSRYEKMLGLPYGGSDTDKRRTLILLKLNESPPVTIETVKEYLRSMYMELDFAVTLDTDNYRLIVTAPKYSCFSRAEVYEFLRRLIPANMELSVDFRRNTYAQILSLMKKYSHFEECSYEELTYGEVN